jgi:hypothetical protein
LWVDACTAPNLNDYCRKECVKLKLGNLLMQGCSQVFAVALSDHLRTGSGHLKLIFSLSDT